MYKFIRYYVYRYLGGKSPEQSMFWAARDTRQLRTLNTRKPRCGRQLQDHVAVHILDGAHGYYLVMYHLHLQLPLPCLPACSAHPRLEASTNRGAT